jgi:endoglucanase
METGGAMSGGTTSSGGMTNSGGVASSGGVTSAGGTIGTGGVAPSGGVTRTGGVTSTGGVTTDGGVASTGGVTSTGGMTRTGGGGVLFSGGVTASGGVTRAGGVSNTGGVSNSGGVTTGAGGSTVATTGIRGLTPKQIVKEMFLGWNLGNTFDGSPNETSWGNPETTQAMVQAVATAGFKTMRIPVTWTNHVGAAPNYTIDSAWMAKVVQVAQWAVDAGLYAIVNTHHDADGAWVKFPDPNVAATQTQVTAEVTAVWTQAATAFKNFSDYLIFECFNEPHGSVNSYGGGDAIEQAELNAYLEACVNAIRGTGGNNALRDIMIQPIGASPVQAAVQSLLKVSIISDPNLIISLHTYYPVGFGLNGNPTTWGASASDYTAMASSLDQILGWLPTQAIVIGEWGSVSKDELTSREKHAKAYTQDVTKRGMCPVWWDNGGSDFGLLNRKANPPTWTYPTIVSNLVAGSTAGSAPGAVDATMP